MAAFNLQRWRWESSHLRTPPPLKPTSQTCLLGEFKGEIAPQIDLQACWDESRLFGRLAEGIVQIKTWPTTWLFGSGSGCRPPLKISALGGQTQRRRSQTPQSPAPVYGGIICWLFICGGNWKMARADSAANQWRRRVRSSRSGEYRCEGFARLKRSLDRHSGCSPAAFALNFCWDSQELPQTLHSPSLGFISWSAPTLSDPSSLWIYRFFLYVGVDIVNNQDHKRSWSETKTLIVAPDVKFYFLIFILKEPFLSF